ncbi:hypothetical protein [Glaciihabitans sp. UYNi722]|uniref:hypothetical protein n=1 Tax=Glaciihabitans sp. UYNi722 TaxID=3156344 RepID=UPI0033917DAC
MSIESEFKRLAEAEVSGEHGIDLAKVIRRSRRRHLGNQVAVGGVTTLAVAGIGVAGVFGVRGLGQQSMSAGPAASSAGPMKASDSPLDGQKRAPAEKINLCGGELAQIAPNPQGLSLTADFPAASASDSSIQGIVTLTNSGSERIVGTTAAIPAITLSKGGVTLWHSNGPMIMMAVTVDLAPGASMTYQASVTPVACGAEDETGDGFRADLPHVEPGEYQVSAAIDLTRENADGSFASNDLVSGPVAPLKLG